MKIPWTKNIKKKTRNNKKIILAPKIVYTSNKFIISLISNYKVN